MLRTPFDMPNYQDVKQLSESWFLLRAGRMTASKVAAAIMLNRYVTRDNLLYQMRHGKPKKEIDSSVKAMMQYGVDHEQDGLATLQLALADKFEFCPREVGAWTAPLTETETMVASPDSIAWCRLTGVPVCVEIKCPRKQGHIDSRTGRFRGHYDHPPLSHVVQCQMQMYATQTKHTLYASWFDGSKAEDVGSLPVKVWEIKRDDEFINDYMLPRLRDFMNNYLLAGYDHNFGRDTGKSKEIRYWTEQFKKSIKLLYGATHVYKKRRAGIEPLEAGYYPSTKPLPAAEVARTCLRPLPPAGMKRERDIKTEEE